MRRNLPTSLQSLTVHTVSTYYETYSLKAHYTRGAKRSLNNHEPVQRWWPQTSCACRRKMNLTQKWTSMTSQRKKCTMCVCVFWRPCMISKQKLHTSINMPTRTTDAHAQNQQAADARTHIPNPWQGAQQSHQTEIEPPIHPQQKARRATSFHLQRNQLSTPPSCTNGPTTITRQPAVHLDSITLNVTSW